MAEGLEPAVGVDREVAVAVEGALEHLLPCRAALGEAEVLHEHELGGREAVVHLGHGQLGAGLGDPRLRVGVFGGAHDLLERRVVVGGVDRAGGRAGHEGKRLHVERVVAVAVGVGRPADHRRRRAVAHPAAVEHAEIAGHERCLGDRLHGHFLLELRPRVARAVLVVLEGDPAHDLLHLVLVHAVLVRVGRGEEREGGGRRQAGVGAVADGADPGQARVARVLELLDPDGHGQVVGARRHGVAGVAEGLGTRRAVVLDPGHRLVVELQRPRQRHAAHARGHGAEPEGVDVVDGHAGRRRRLGRRVGQEVVDALVPQLTEAGAAHADDGHLVANAAARHCPYAPCSAASRSADAPPASGRAFQK